MAARLQHLCFGAASRAVVNGTGAHAKAAAGARASIKRLSMSIRSQQTGLPEGSFTVYNPQAALTLRLMMMPRLGESFSGDQDRGALPRLLLEFTARGDDEKYDWKGARRVMLSDEEIGLILDSEPEEMIDIKRSAGNAGGRQTSSKQITIEPTRDNAWTVRLVQDGETREVQVSRGKKAVFKSLVRWSLPALYGFTTDAPPRPRRRPASPSTGTDECLSVVGLCGLMTEAGVQDIIAELDALALNKASAVIKKRFSEPIHLDDVQELRAEYKKKLSSIELQLSGMVQVKLDGVKRAMDVIHAANDAMNGLRTEFDNMHDLCRKAGEQGKLLFDAYPRLKQINRARKNLERTLTEVNYYANLSSRVSVLVDTLETNPMRIKQVYLEGQQLEMWREELLRELKTQQSFRSPGYGLSRETVMDRMQATFGVHLEAVKRLLDAIRKKIFDNISNCFEIVQAVKRLLDAIRKKIFDNISICFEIVQIDPRILVYTLEIIDMHEAFQKKKAEDAKERARVKGEDAEEALVLSLIEDLRADIVVKLKHKVDDRASELFAEAASRDASESKFGSKLNAATKVIVDLEYLQSEVTPCFPDSYNIMDIFRTQYEATLVKQISTLYQGGFPQLDQGELLQLMEWLDYYNQEIVHLGAEVPCDEFVRALSVCLQEYLVRVRIQMTEWFTNILNREPEVASNSEGQPITSTPEDFFNIIHLQVLVALAKLSADNMSAVVVVCLNVIKTILEETLTQLRRKREDPNSNLEVLCATVNDYDRLQEKIQEFREELGHMGKMGDDQLAVIDASMDQVLDGFVAIADEANSSAAAMMLRDVKEGLVEDLFSAEWEESVDVMMQGVTMTFKDYYNDLCVWLPPFYFSKLVRECLEKIVTMYMFFLFKRSRKEDKGKKPFRDPLVVAQKIRNDRQALAEFFNDYDTELEKAGLRDAAAVELQLLLLDNIADLFEHGVQADSEATAPLLREFSLWGVDGLLGISYLRGDKDRTRTELKDSLTRFYDRIIKPSLATSGSGGGAGGSIESSRAPLPSRFPLSPLDADVDLDAFMTGVMAKKVKGKK